MSVNRLLFRGIIFSQIVFLAFSMNSYADSNECDIKDKSSYKKHHGKGPHSDMFNKKFMKKMSKKLNLSDEQREKVQNIVEKNGPQIKDVKVQMHETMEKLNGLDSVSADYDTNLSKLSNQQASLIATSVKLKHQMQVQINEILDEDQKSKFKKLMKKRHHRGEKKKY